MNWVIRSRDSGNNFLICQSVRKKNLGRLYKLIIFIYNNFRRQKHCFTKKNVVLAAAVCAIIQIFF